MFLPGKAKRIINIEKVPLNFMEPKKIKTEISIILAYNDTKLFSLDGILYCDNIFQIF